MATNQNGKMLTVKQAADKMGVVPGTIYNWIHKGVRGVKIEAKSNGGKTLIDPEVFADFNEQIATRRGFND